MNSIKIHKSKPKMVLSCHGFFGMNQEEKNCGECNRYDDCDLSPTYIEVKE